MPYVSMVEDRPALPGAHTYMTRFTPDRCPHPACEHAVNFQFQRFGRYERKCDGREVQRFRCKTCRHSFSIQTFRFDYRQRKPHINHPVLNAFVSKCTQRQLSRTLLLNRKTIARRLEQMGRHCEAFHRGAMATAPSLVHFHSLAMDELETFEANRLQRPLTMPMVVVRGSYFIVDFEVGALAPRTKRPAGVPRHTRRSESSKAVAAVLARVARALQATAVGELVTDKKKTYPALIRCAFGRRLQQRSVSAKAERSNENPLFAVNLTFAMLRDGISRLVRRNWAHSKLAARLVRHAWIWVAWRNYVRPRTVRDPDETAATMVGAVSRPLIPMEMIRDRLVWD